MGATSDWCSAPCRPDGLLSLDMPVQSASGLHSLGYCPSAVDPAHEKILMKPHAGGIQKYTSVAPEHEEHSIMIIQEKHDRPVRQTRRRKNTEVYKHYSIPGCSW